LVGSGQVISGRRRCAVSVANGGGQPIVVGGRENAGKRRRRQAAAAEKGLAPPPPIPRAHYYCYCAPQTLYVTVYVIVLATTGTSCTRCYCR